MKIQVCFTTNKDVPLCFVRGLLMIYYVSTCTFVKRDSNETYLYLCMNNVLSIDSIRNLASNVLYFVCICC